MSEPEIDRRCSLCGATVRARATFCPQCGQPTARPSRAADTQIDLRETPVVKNYDTVPLIREQIPDLSETQPLSAVPIAVPPPPEPKPVNTPPPAKERVAKGRVDRIRKASSIVIDQAAYDPSLRFVLVALALFLLFLFLLIMSKVLG